MRKLLLSFALIGLLQLDSSAQMSPRPRPDGVPGESPRGRPPAMIALDEAAARDLLAKVDEGRNALLLQMNLFMRPTGTVSAEAAFPLLDEQIAKETVGSKRWAQLQNLRAFGGFRVPGFNADANDAYKLLFSTPITPENGQIIASALSSLTGSIGGRNGIGRGDHSTTADVAQAALKAYLALPETVKAPELNWADISKAFPGESGPQGLLPALLKDKTAPEALRFRTLKTALQMVVDGGDAETALEWLEEAEPLAQKLAPDDEKFNDLAVRVYMRNEEKDKALGRQKAFVARTNRGFGPLLFVLWQRGLKEDFAAAVTALQDPKIDAETVTSGVATLRRLEDKEGFKPKEDARKIAETFITQTERTPENIVSMRSTLARILYRSGDKEGAAKMLEETVLPGEDSPRLSRQLEAMKKTAAQMREGKYYEN